MDRLFCWVIDFFNKFEQFKLNFKIKIFMIIEQEMFLISYGKCNKLLNMNLNA